MLGKSIFNRIACALVLTFSLASAGAQLISRGDGHLYGKTPAGSWTAAEAYAVSQGGHLVTIDDSAENEFIRLNFLTGAGASQDFWIGLRSPSGDFTDPSTWSWVSGSSSTYRDWRSGEPDFGIAEDRYAAINYVQTGDSSWDNYPDTGFRSPQGIYELVPEPSVAGLLVLGALILLKTQPGRSANFSWLKSPSLERAWEIRESPDHRNV